MVESHKHAAAAVASGKFIEEIIPVVTKGIDLWTEASYCCNASEVSNGAAAVLLMKRSTASQRGLPILGVFSFAAIGVEPSVMGIGPAAAIPTAVKSAGLEGTIWGDVTNSQQCLQKPGIVLVGSLRSAPQHVIPIGRRQSQD